MAQLIVNYSSIDTLKSTIDKANKYFSRRQETIDGVRSNISGISTNRSYLESAVNELYSRDNEISEKISKISKFKSDLDSFSEEAQATDQRVANRIITGTTSFCYSSGIGVTKTEEESLWQKFTGWAGDRCDDIHEWYDENKEIIWATIEVVANIAFCVLAVIAFIATLPASGFFAICAAIAAGFVLAKSVADVVSSGASLGYYVRGDNENGEAWAKRDLLKDGFAYTGSWFDSKLSNQFGYKGHVFETIFSSGYDVLTVISLVSSLHSVGKNFFKSFKLSKLKWKNIFKSSWRDSVKLKGRFTDTKNWKEFGKKVIGVDSVKDRRAKNYKDLAKSIKFVNDKIPIISISKGTTMNFYKYKIWGTNAKVAYKTVQGIYNNDNIFSGTSLGGTIKTIPKGASAAGRLILNLAH